jgi:hypothetical protein
MAGRPSVAPWVCLLLLRDRGECYSCSCCKLAVLLPPPTSLPRSRNSAVRAPGSPGRYTNAPPTEQPDSQSVVSQVRQPARVLSC